MGALVAGEPPDAHSWMFLSSNFGFRYWMALYAIDRLGIAKSRKLYEEVFNEIRAQVPMNREAGSLVAKRLVSLDPQIEQNVDLLRRRYFMVETIPSNDRRFAIDFASLTNLDAIAKVLR